MKFVVISDTHCRHKSLKLPKGDVLLHAGDITYKGEASEVKDFLTWFGQQNFTHKIFIAGNHDFYFEKTIASVIENLIPENVIYLKDSGTTINGINIWGSPVTPWFHNWAFNRQRGSAINKHWKQIPPDTDVLITHGPPFGILDTVITNSHVGCKDLLKRLQQVHPQYHVFGHIHEAYGKKKMGATQYINASVLNESYELVNAPVTFDL